MNRSNKNLWLVKFVAILFSIVIAQITVSSASAQERRYVYSGDTMTRPVQINGKWQHVNFVRGSLYSDAQISALHPDYYRHFTGFSRVNVSTPVKTKPWVRYDRAIPGSSSLSALAVIGLGAAAAGGSTDVNASSVHSATTDGNGAPAPLTLQGTNVRSRESNPTGFNAILAPASNKPNSTAR